MRIARLNPQTGKMELFAPNGEYIERFADDFSESLTAESLAGDKENPNGTFDILAHTGASVERWYGDLILNLSGMKRDKTTTALDDHDDRLPVGVIKAHSVDGKGLHLSGGFLSREASEEAHKIRLRAKEGIKYKASVGARFVRYHFLKEDESETVNGRTFKFNAKKDTVIVDEWFLFECSFLSCNPADLGTRAEIMRNGDRHMGETAKEQMGAALGSPSPAPAPSATPAPGVLAPATIAKLSDVSPEIRRALVIETKAELTRLSGEFSKAFPSRPDFCAKMMDEGKSVEQAKIIAYEELEAKRREQEAATSEADRSAILANMTAKTGRTAEGFSPAGHEASLVAPTLPGVYRMEAERQMHSSRAAVVLFGHEALNVMTRAVQFKHSLAKRQHSGDEMSPVLSASDVETCARLLWDSCDSQRKAEIVRLGGNGAGMDLSRITVSGFADSYHNAMDSEEPWGIKLCYEASGEGADQETIVLRWLDYFPQLQLLGTGPEERNVQVRQMQWTNQWFDATVGFRVMDFMLQKFAKINQLMGQAGAVHKKHWNKLVSAQLELNAKGYDGIALFSTLHALGGTSPATQSNDVSVANGQAWCQVADINDITPSEMNTIFLNASTYFSTFRTADNEPMNEDEKEQFIVIAPPKWAGLARAAVFSNRLDGSAHGAGGSRDNPLQEEAKRKGASWDVVNGSRLTAANNYIYLAMVQNDRKPILRSEPIPLSMYFEGFGSDMHKKLNKVGFWSRAFRSTASGAFTSILRITLA